MLPGRRPPRLDRPVGQETPKILGQGRRARIPAPRLLRHRFQDDRLQVARDPRIDPAGPGRLDVEDPLHQPGPVARDERRAQRQHLVERQPQPVDVATAVGPAAEALRGHVPQRADDVPLVGQLHRVVRLRQPEVGDPGGPLRVQEDIRRLDVAMQDALVMRVVQRLGDLQADARHAPDVLDLGLGRQLRPAPRPRRLDDRRARPDGGHRRRPDLRRDRLDGDGAIQAPREQLAGQALPQARRPRRGPPRLGRQPAKPPDLLQHDLQVLPLDVLHRVIMDAVRLAHAEHGHDVRMVQSGGGPGLSAKSFELALAHEPVERQDLQRDVAAQRLLHGLVDDAHPAPRELAEDPVLAQPVERRLRPPIRPRRGPRPLLRRAQPLHRDHRREDPPNPLGMLGIPPGVITERGPLSATVAIGELLRQVD